MRACHWGLPGSPLLWALCTWFDSFLCALCVVFLAQEHENESGAFQAKKDFFETLIDPKSFTHWGLLVGVGAGAGAGAGVAGVAVVAAAAVAVPSAVGATSFSAVVDG